MTTAHTHTAEDAYEQLYRFALSLSKCSSAASDLVQQTYWKWLKYRGRIRNPAKTRSWLFTTLYREFLKEVRRGNRLRFLEDGEPERDIPSTQWDAGRSLDGEMAMQALQQVPDPYRASLSLFYVEDLSYMEIADVLDIAPGTVMSRIHRGKQFLKKAFDERDELGSPHLRESMAARGGHGAPESRAAAPGESFFGNMVRWLRLIPLMMRVYPRTVLLGNPGSSTN